MADPFADLPLAGQAAMQPQQQAPQDPFADLPSAQQPQGGQGDAGPLQQAGQIFRAGVDQLNPMAPRNRAFLENFADEATLGLAPRAASYLSAGVSHLNPWGDTVSPAEAYARIKADETQMRAEHPDAALAGTVGGLLGGGAGIARGGAALAGAGLPVVSGAAEAMMPVAGQGWRNAGRAALGGAGMAATSEAANSGQVDSNTAVAGLTGAVAGPIVGKAAGLAARGARAVGDALGPRVSDDLSRGWGVIARRLRVSPTVLSRALDTMRNVTGQEVTPAMVLRGADAATIRRLAQVNPGLGDALREHTAAVTARQPAAVSGMLEANAGPIAGPKAPEMVKALGNRAPSPADVEAARTSLGDAQLAPLMANPAPIDAEDLALLTSKPIRRALKEADKASTNLPGEEPSLWKKLQTAKEAFTGPDGKPIPGMMSDTLTVRDIDSIRQELGRAAKNPNNSQIAQKLGDLRDRITHLGGEDYANAVQNYRVHSDYVRGFQHGLTGASKNAATDAELRRSLGTASGHSGYSAGLVRGMLNKAGSSEAGAAGVSSGIAQNAEPAALLREAVGPLRASEAQQAMRANTEAMGNLNAVTPPRAGPHDQIDLHDPAVAAAEFGGGMHGVGTARVGRFLSRAFSSDRLAPGQEAQLAHILTDPDPVRQRQGIAILRRLGASNDKIRQIQQGVAMLMGADVGENTAAGANAGR